MRCTVTATISLWVCGVTIALASLSAPSSSARISADGKRLLVMVSPALKYEQEHPTTFELPDHRQININQTFAKSGCYDSVTFNPVWQVDWFSLKGDLFCSDDLTDVLRVNRFGLDSDWALAFYHEGHLTHRYACSELLTALKSKVFFPYTTNWHYAWYDSYKLDKNRLVVSTARRSLSLDGYKLDLGLQEFYTFDLSTGAIIDFSRISLWPQMCLVIAIILICSIFLGFWLWWQNRRQQPAKSDLGLL